MTTQPQNQEQPHATPPDGAGAVAASNVPTCLEPLAARARDYAKAANSANTRRAYAADWKHFCAWCRRQRLEVTPPDPEIVGLYIAACASGAANSDGQANSVATIERRLSALAWNYTQRGAPLDRKDQRRQPPPASRSS